VHIYQQKIFSGPVVEATGAGDAYASAFLGALISGRTVIDAMRWGTINSAMVLRFVGGREGLQTKAQIENLLLQHSEFRPRVLL
jgi:sugar/nucleoside kinase (ribokinase family)